MTRYEAGGSGATRTAATIDRIEGFYAALDQLSRTLADSAADGAIEDLLDLLEQRAELILGLESLAEDYRAAVETVKDGASPVPVDDRAALAQRLSRIDALGSEIAARDAEVGRVFEGRKSAMGRELSEIGNKSAAVAAYAPDRGRAPAPRFQDREG